jgi:ribosomal protein S18 acetylase RimI-like enzyme
VISVEVAALADEDLYAAVNALVPQLSSSSPPPSLDELARIVEDPATTLFVAHEGDRIVGMLTLVAFRIPTAQRAFIEDVVVDEAARGTGVAAALVQAALDRAAELGVRTVDLTSRPHREAAHRLYLRMGFEVRETNVYRRTLTAP